MNRRLRLRFATHGLAAAIGLAAGMVWLDGEMPATRMEDATLSAPSAAARKETVSSWVTASLANAGQQREEIDHYRDWEKLPIPELLQRNRREADEEKADLQREIDAIITASARFLDHPDPASLIRDLGRTDDAATFAAFHAWQQRDPDAAFAFLCRNWRMADDSWTTPALLEREYGREWMMRKLHDVQTPYRLRNSLALGLAQSLAWDGDLTGLIRLYQAVLEPKFKDTIAYQIGSDWPLADPAETARMLSAAPVELRNRLLGAWAPLVNNPFMGHSMPPQYASVEWFRQLRAALDPSLVPAGIRDNPCDPWYLMLTPDPAGQQESTEANLETIAPALPDDARALNFLDRNRVLWDAAADTKTRETILQHARSKWRVWHDFAPRHAEAWRDTLPSGHPLRQDLTKSE